MSRVFTGSVPGDVGTTTQYEVLGTYVSVPASSVASPADAGPQIWVYVKNDEASTAFAAGTVVMHESGAVTYKTKVAATSSHPDNIVGVAQSAIAAGSFGWILAWGKGVVTADTGGLTAGKALVSGNAVAGTADDQSAATDAAFGVTITTTTATNAAPAFIKCKTPGI